MQTAATVISKDTKCPRDVPQ